MRPCIKCYEMKPMTEFHRDALGRDGYKVKCKDCCRQARRDRRYAIGGPVHSIGEVQILNHIRDALIKIKQDPTEISIPVSAINNPFYIKNGFVIRQDYVYIRSIKGIEQLPTDVVTPHQLLDLLKSLHVKVRLYDEAKSK